MSRCTPALRHSICGVDVVRDGVQMSLDIPLRQGPSATREGNRPSVAPSVGASTDSRAVHPAEPSGRQDRSLVRRPTERRVGMQSRRASTQRWQTMTKTGQPTDAATTAIAGAAVLVSAVSMPHTTAGSEADPESGSSPGTIYRSLFARVY